MFKRAGSHEEAVVPISRRRLVLGAASAGAALPVGAVLAACGSQAAAPAPKQVSGKIDFWLLGDATVITGVIEVANEIAPAVTVSITPVPGGWAGIEEKTQAGLAAGTGITVPAHDAVFLMNP